MEEKSVKAILLAIILLPTAISVRAQTSNLLRNPNADESGRYWRAFGNATVEEATGSFIVRNGGYFVQDVAIPESAVGEFAVLIGRASSERINSDGAITGLPYLYGYMMNPGDPSGGRIYAYLQGQNMRSAAKVENEWAYLWGIFQVPVGTGRVRFFLNQAERKGVPHNGSAARFDDLGFYLFPTEGEARAFVETKVGVSADSNKAAASSTSHKTQCTLGLSQAPELYGLRLGMSAGEVLALFPGSGEDEYVQRTLSRSQSSGSIGHAWLKINPHKYSAESRYAEVKIFALRILDGRVFYINVEFNGPQWKSVDEFISRYAGELNLPTPDAWEQAQYSISKYLICDGFEIRFYAAPQRSSNTNYIDIIDNLAAKILNDRKARGKDKAHR